MYLYPLLDMTNEEIFEAIELGNSKKVNNYLLSYDIVFLKHCRGKRVYTILSDHQIAEAYHDACILVYEKIENEIILLHQMSATIKTLVFEIGKKSLLNKVRSEAKYGKKHFSLFLKDEQVSDEVEAQNTLEKLVLEEEINQLEEYMQLLTEEERTLIIEGIMEEKSNDEIAKRHKYPSKGSVATAKNRAFNKLKNLFFDKKKSSL